jgi:hypothetical protein
MYCRSRPQRKKFLKVGDKGVIPVKVTGIDVTGRWITFSIAGYAHPITMYEPAIV